MDQFIITYFYARYYYDDNWTGFNMDPNFKK